MGGYNTLQEMIKKEHKLSEDIVRMRAYNDEEKLTWWEGRLDAWTWCKEQLEKEQLEKEQSTEQVTNAVAVDRGTDEILRMNNQDIAIHHLTGMQVIHLLNRLGVTSIETMSYDAYEEQTKKKPL